MTATEIRTRFFDYYSQRGHHLLTRAPLVPQDDPTTLFTGSGMQPLLPYLLGQSHPAGQRLVNSQPCLRAQDIDEVGDNRHTTGFEMLGNWSLGDYFKEDQLRWFFDFLIDEIGLDVSRLYTSCFIGSKRHNLDPDQVSANILQGLYQERGLTAPIVSLGSAADGDRQGMGSGRIFYYDDQENWWSRGGGLETTPVGDPAGGDCEFFYDFGPKHHDDRFGAPHPASDSGRFLEIGNAVFMEYSLKDDGRFVPLPRQNVDFGGGLERLAAAATDQADVFLTDLLKPLIDRLETVSGRQYQDQQERFRVIADHWRAASWLVVDGVRPSNKDQGYVLRRLIRRAVRVGFGCGIDTDLAAKLTPAITTIYGADYPEFASSDDLVAVFAKEESVFRQTLRSGLRHFQKLTDAAGEIDGAGLFHLYDTYGFPIELSIEEARRAQVKLKPTAEADFAALMAEQRARSRAAVRAGRFKGGLADDQPMTVKHHTATHLLYRALRLVLGDEVVQRGSNVTVERLRFDFSWGEKLTPEQIDAIETIVNDQIRAAIPVSWRVEATTTALANGVLGAFGDKYGPEVKVYTVGDPDGDHYSREICGGPHVGNTSELADGGRAFKILKQQASSAGVRRLKAALV